jgi:hypothetical protein
MPGSSPADIGPINSLTISPNQTITYASGDLFLTFGSSGDSGAVYTGSSVGSGTVAAGETFSWSFSGYDRITPTSDNVVVAATGPDATFIVPSGTATFAFSNPFFPDVAPANATITIAPGGPPVTLHQVSNPEAPPGTPEVGLAQGIAVSFVDPAVSTGMVSWDNGSNIGAL